MDVDHVVTWLHVHYLPCGIVYFQVVIRIFSLSPLSCLATRLNFLLSFVYKVVNA